MCPCHPHIINSCWYSYTTGHPGEYLTADRRGYKAMDYHVLFHLARVKPLTGWSIGGSLIGIGVAVWQVGYAGVDWPLLLLAVSCAILLQYVAHPLNDLMDRDVDAAAKIPETGRAKPLVAGTVTEAELKAFSVVLILIAVLISGYLILIRPLALGFALFGFFALIGYNTAPLRLAYHPYTEYYLAVPANALVVVAVAYVATESVTPVAVVLGILHGFAASAFFVSMMSMDLPSDIRNGKITTVGRHPTLPWGLIFPGIGLLIATALIVLVLPGAMGSSGALLIAAITVPVYLVLAALGSRVDVVRRAYLRGVEAAFEEKTGNLRLLQLYVSIFYSVALLAVCVGVQPHG